MLGYRGSVAFFLVSCKIVYRWVTINCSFMSDVKKQIWRDVTLHRWASNDTNVWNCYIRTEFLLTRGTQDQEMFHSSALQEVPVVVAAMLTCTLRSKTVDNMHKKLTQNGPVFASTQRRLFSLIQTFLVDNILRTFTAVNKKSIYISAFENIFCRL